MRINSRRFPLHLKYSLFRFIILISSVVLLSGCQIIQVTIEFPGLEPTSFPSAAEPSLSVPTRSEISGTALLPATLMPSETPLSFSATLTPSLTVSPTAQAAFDPLPYLLTLDDLPKNISMSGGDLQTLSISYLESQGDLLGMAYVCGYQAFPEELFITETLFQSPEPFQPGLLRSGHFNRDFIVADDKLTLGEGAVYYVEGNQHVNYRFYRENVMVSIELAGNDPYITLENALLLAETVQDRLPQELPQPRKLGKPDLEVQQDEYDKYFRDLKLVDCEGENEEISNYSDDTSGYCFSADVIEYIDNFKAGIYNVRYSQLVYVKEFHSSPLMGEGLYGIFNPIYGYGWDKLRSGDYLALFWVNDKLVASRPFSYE